MFTTRFKIARTNCNITLNEVAAEAGISRQRLAIIESGNQGCRYSKQRHLTKALKLLIHQRKREIFNAEKMLEQYKNQLFDPIKW